MADDANGVVGQTFLFAVLLANKNVCPTNPPSGANIPVCRFFSGKQECLPHERGAWGLHAAGSLTMVSQKSSMERTTRMNSSKSTGLLT